MELDNTAEKVAHCDDPSCDLGSVYFNCQYCNKLQQNYDYDVYWMEQDEIKELKCCECGKINIMKFDKEDDEFKVYKLGVTNE